MKKYFITAALAACTFASFNAQALTIGDIEIQSAYGQRFSARIPLQLAAGEDVVPGCVRLESIDPKNVSMPTLVNYSLRVEPARAGKSAILLSTSDALTEPAVRIGLVVRCAKTSSSREFIVNQKLADTKK
jgi:pilus assembly protein FimV